MQYTYKVVPAPAKGLKAKGAKTTADRFALALAEVMNDQAGEGWEYVRAETLPCEERQGLTGKSNTPLNMLVFRKPKAGAALKTERVPLAPVIAAPVPAPALQAPQARPAAEDDDEITPERLARSLRRNDR